MSEEQDNPWTDLYFEPVFQLVTGLGTLRERLREAIEALERKAHEARADLEAVGASNVWKTHENDLRNLDSILAKGRDLDSLTDFQCSQLASGILEVHVDMHELAHYD